MNVNHDIYKDYPGALRTRYQQVVDHEDASLARHTELLYLAQAATALFASLRFSTYRASCGDSPEANLERYLADRQGEQPTFGHYAALLRMSSTGHDPSVLPPGLLKRKLEAPSRLLAAADAVDEAVRISASGVDQVIDKRLKAQNKGVSWLEFWDSMPKYRNKALGHQDTSRWPTTDGRFLSRMVALLEEAVVEALSQPEVAETLRRYPVAVLRSVTELDELFTFELDFEDRGIPKHESVALTAAEALVVADPELPAQGDVVVLDTAGPGAPRVIARYIDIVAAKRLPGPLLTPEPAIEPDAVALHESATARAGWVHGAGIAPGTCGELAQGLLPDGRNFHVTCPMNTKSATVKLSMRPAAEFAVRGLEDWQEKIELSLARTAKVLDIGEVELKVHHWSDMQDNIGKGMGSSTADVLAAARALANAAGEELTPEQLGEIASSVESSDGTMYPGLAVVNHKTGMRLRDWDWWPEFIVVMLIPPNQVATESVTFDGKERLTADYAAMLETFDRAVAQRDTAAFAAQATRSAELNERFLVNRLFRKVAGELERLGALGANVGHTGTVCGVLFENDDDGRSAAIDASMELEDMFPKIDVELGHTPVRLQPDD